MQLCSKTQEKNIIIICLKRYKREEVSSFLSVHCPGLGGRCFHELLPKARIHARTKIENVGVVLVDGVL